MKRTAAAVLAAGFIAAALAAQPAQEKGKAPSKKDIAAMLEKRGGPVEQHKALEPLVGEFDAEFRMNAGPGAPPMTAAGTASAKWILGKRFVQVSTAPAQGEDLKIESQATFGYDKRTSKYFWWGIDSTDTYSVWAEGTYDDKTKTFTLLGTNEEPGVGKLPFKTVIQIKDEKTNTVQIWFQMKGAPGADAEGWFMVVENVYTRKGA